MARWFMDGFEFYSSPGDVLLNANAQAGWTSLTGGGALSTNTPYASGRSWTNGTLTKTGFSNQGTVFAAVYNGYATSGAGAYISFMDGTSAQVTIVFTGANTVNIYSGSNAGTLIGTWTPIRNVNQWYQYQVKVVIHNTAGEVHIRQGGNTVDDYTLTSVNTRGGTTNNYANAIKLEADGSAYVDHFAVWDATNDGTVLTDWIGDLKIEAHHPISNNSIQYSINDSSSSHTMGHSVNTGGTWSQGANVIFLWQFTAPCGGSLGPISVELNSGFTGHMKIALYKGDGDNSSFPKSGAQAGTLLYTSNEITNPVTGVNSFSWPSAPAIVNGETYFFGIWSDAGYVQKRGTSAVQEAGISVTYGASFPSSLVGLGSYASVTAGTIYATITATNFGMVNDRGQDGATTYVFDGTVGDSDLYGIEGFTSTPLSIIAVDVVAMLCKSDAGARGIQVQIKSGATLQQYAQVFPNTAFNFYRYMQDKDPATSAAWLPAAVSSALVGQTTST